MKRPPISYAMSIVEGKTSLFMYLYEKERQMQFDIKKDVKSIINNITIEEAKQLRNRLDDFINWCTELDNMGVPKV